MLFTKEQIARETCNNSRLEINIWLSTFCVITTNNISYIRPTNQTQSFCSEDLSKLFLNTSFTSIISLAHITWIDRSTRSQVGTPIFRRCFACHIYLMSASITPTPLTTVQWGQSFCAVTHAIISFLCSNECICIW